MHQLPNTKKPTRNELVFYVIFYFFNSLKRLILIITNTIVALTKITNNVL